MRDSLTGISKSFRVESPVLVKGFGIFCGNPARGLPERSRMLTSSVSWRAPLGRSDLDHKPVWEMPHPALDHLDRCAAGDRCSRQRQGLPLMRCRGNGFLSGLRVPDVFTKVVANFTCERPGLPGRLRCAQRRQSQHSGEEKAKQPREGGTCRAHSASLIRNEPYPQLKTSVRLTALQRIGHTVDHGRCSRIQVVDNRRR